MDLLGFEISTTPILIFALTVILYFYLTWNHDFWKKKGIPGPRPFPVIGTMFPVFTKGIMKMNDEYTQKYGKVVGTFDGSRPSLIITDLDLIRQIMVKEFSTFTNRVPKSLVIKEFPVSHFMTVILDDHWRQLRNSLSPAFSGNKLRFMMSQLNNCTDQLVNNFLEKANTAEPFEVKKFTGGYTMDVIASVGFGVQLDTQKDPDNVFIKMATKALQTNLQSLSVLMLLFFPSLYGRLAKPLNLRLFPQDVTDFFLNLINQAIEKRKEHTELQDRTDFLQLMLNAEREELRPEDIDKEIHGLLAEDNQGNNLVKKGLSKEDILGTSLIFFLAGYDTTANTLAFLAYNLAINPDCQEKLYEEVQQVMAGKDTVTYDMVHQMPYLDMCIHETLRLYPPAVRTLRAGSLDITINGVFIPKQSNVVVPVYTLHHDPDLWPEPEQFKPERFSNKAKAARDPYCYMPFGVGPRNCIGMRLAQVEMKVAVAKALCKVKFTKCTKTEVPIKLTKNGLLKAQNGIYLSVEARQ